jgi:Diacylglycerol kinase catalytic domain
LDAVMLAPFSESVSPSPTAAAPLSWPAAAFDPAAPVRIGVLLNPRSRSFQRERSAGNLSLRDAAGPCSVVAETRDLAEIPGALARMARAGVNVLAVAGGDGALHHALQPLIAARWPGRLLLLGGGTLNIVARTLGPSAPPQDTLAAFRARFGGATYGRLPRHDIPLLGVTAAGLGARYGFIFGSEMVKNAIEMYDQFGGGYEGLSRFLFEAGRGYLLRTELWKRERWRLEPPPLGLAVEGGGLRRAVPRYSAAIACTVDLTIGRGVIRALEGPAGHGRFSARVISETRTGALLSMIPDLMRGLPLDSVVDVPEAHAMRLHGSYTLDGECFGVSTRSPGRPPALTVEAAGRVSFIATLTR